MALRRFLIPIVAVVLLAFSAQTSAASGIGAGSPPSSFVFEDSTDQASDVIGFHSHAVAEGQITRLYRAYFNRAPDETGLNYWLRTMKQGSHLQDISGFFAESQEFRVRYGSVSDDEFVALLYRNVLRRQPDTRGLNYWRQTLDDGHSRGQLMTFFSESPEYVERTKTTPPDFDDRSVMERKNLTYEERRGYAALDKIGFAADRYLPEWEIRFLPQRAGHLGLTYPSSRVIEVYVRPTQSQSLLEHVVAHEMGHAVDVTLLSSSERQEWQEARGISDRPWWPGNGADDRSTGAGDFAESFAALQLDTPHFQSQIAGFPTASQERLMTRLFLN